jgi:ribosomal protein S18 acetylase RimI-like enzyme
LILNVKRNNAQAIRAYKRYGFTIREALDNDIGNGFVMDDCVVEKSLAVRSDLSAPPSDVNMHK